MHRPPKNRAVYLVLVSLLWSWGLNLIVIVKVEVSTGEEEIMVIIIKKFIVGIRTLKLNLFELMARVSYCRVYKRELKLIATYLTTL